MKKACVVLGVMILAVLMACPAFAAMGQFMGKWSNTDANTRGITTLEIAAAGRNRIDRACLGAVPSSGLRLG